MKDLIETIARALVDYPEEVKVLEETKGEKLTYQLTVHPEDTGKVIGKQGRVAKSLRTVVNAAAAGQNKYVTIVIK
ncbi:hypothetical protein CIB95_03135 [Lottiidibacillus patelloidae]|jgi:uncharacterized protein|uniref:RNA-binding protein KhpA n=1 Tax=Lottiidibacillus patelloidae TaxID=2670334 RepID=A0A263BYA1_9BACI|nr:KH domain-containing protein [Lottiidibacillus patelloidae]OZM58578.1 hypothetical protein CIB95_03135 [Lottiidibacillus patelloidae]